MQAVLHDSPSHCGFLSALHSLMEVCQGYADNLGSDYRMVIREVDGVWIFFAVEEWLAEEDGAANGKYTFLATINDAGMVTAHDHIIELLMAGPHRWVNI